MMAEESLSDVKTNLHMDATLDVAAAVVAAPLFVYEMLENEQYFVVNVNC